jgi:hypothetical protein
VTGGWICPQFRNGNENILDLYSSPNVNSVVRLHEGVMSRYKAYVRRNENAYKF